MPLIPHFTEYTDKPAGEYDELYDGEADYYYERMRDDATVLEDGEGAPS